MDSVESCCTDLEPPGSAIASTMSRGHHVIYVGLELVVNVKSYPDLQVTSYNTTDTQLVYKLVQIFLIVSNDQQHSKRECKANVGHHKDTTPHTAFLLGVDQHWELKKILASMQTQILDGYI